MHVHCVCAELNMQKNIVCGSDAQYDFERCTYRLSVLPCTEFITIWIVRIQGLFEYVYVRLCVCNDLYCHALSNDTQRQVAGYSAGAYRHCLSLWSSLTHATKKNGTAPGRCCCVPGDKEYIHSTHTHTIIRECTAIARVTLENMKHPDAARHSISINNRWLREKASTDVSPLPLRSCNMFESK